VLEALITSGLDQDYAAAVDHFDALSEVDRWRVAKWIVAAESKPGTLLHAPLWVQGSVARLASIAFVEVSLRWADRQEEQVVDG
jgi:hypothetical protein